MSSFEEKFEGQRERYAAKPDSVRHPMTWKDSLEDLPMNIHAPKTVALDSNKDGGHGFMSRAVEHLKRETQREEHAPMVGGYHHDHTMR